MLDARFVGLLFSGLLVYVLITLLAISDDEGGGGEDLVPEGMAGSTGQFREEPIEPARSPQGRNAEKQSGALPDGYMNPREAIEARYGDGAHEVLSKLGQEGLLRPMLDPALAADQFMERLDPKSGPLAATMYRQHVLWPGMSLHTPAIVPMGNYAELRWQHLPVVQSSLKHLEESYVFDQAEAFAASYNAELDSLARDYVDEYFEIMSSRVRSGMFEQHPSEMQDLSPSDWGVGLPKARHTVGGWTMKVTMDSPDWEALRELGTRIQEIKERRTRYLEVKLANL